MIKKSLVIALCYYAVLLAGCIKDRCNCPTPKTGKFNYKAITPTNLVYSFPADSTFIVSASTADTLQKDRFGLRFRFSFETAYQQCPKMHRPGLFNSAFACSCVEDNFTSKDTIRKISLKTLLDFDASHPAGSDVTDYFKTVYLNYSPATVKFDEAFAASYYDFNNQYTAQGTKEYDLYLKTVPTDSRKAAFLLSIEYANGKSLSATSSTVYLK